MTAFDGIRVQPGAANYFSGVGALERFEAFYPAGTLRQVLWIGGRRALAAARPYLPPVFDDDARSLRRVFSGHCSESLVSGYVRDGRDADLVVGIGGGSALDTAKAVATRLDKPFVAIPTVAATCAAWTPLSVWYDDDGRALGYEMFPLASRLVLVDPRIVLTAPPEYLSAGIGDTLAKWYEARVLCDAAPALPLTAQLGLSVARQIHDVLLEKGEAAVAAAKVGANAGTNPGTNAGAVDGTVNEAFVQVVDAIIAGGGLVGGLGERYTRLAAAHAIHNGLTVIPATASILHGAKVAYGILVQLALEGRRDELLRLDAALLSLGLPRRLADLGVDPARETDIAAFVAHTLRPEESIHFLSGTVDAPRLRKALAEVEALPALA